MAWFSRTVKLSQLKNLTCSSFRRLSLAPTPVSRSSVLPSTTLHSGSNYPWVQHTPNQVVLPFSITDRPIRLPSGLYWILPFDEPDILNKVIEEPANNDRSSDNSIQAVRLIVIRRKKMKKHKLRKLRKKMKYVWAKVRQRRELKKEKEFQAGLIAQCKEAEAFSAEEYVAEKIRKATEVPIPRFWKGRRLPEFLIRQKLGLPPKPI